MFFYFLVRLSSEKIIVSATCLFTDFIKLTFILVVNVQKRLFYDFLPVYRCGLSLFHPNDQRNAIIGCRRSHVARQIRRMSSHGVNVGNRSWKTNKYTLCFMIDVFTRKQMNYCIQRVNLFSERTSIVKPYH